MLRIFDFILLSAAGQAPKRIGCDPLRDLLNREPAVLRILPFRSARSHSLMYLSSSFKRRPVRVTEMFP